MTKGNASPGGGQLDDRQIQQAMQQFGTGNLNNQISDPRQPPGLLQGSAQNAMRGLEMQAKMGGGQSAMPMPENPNTALQNLQGLLASSKANKMAALKMITGGG